MHVYTSPVKKTYTSSHHYDPIPGVQVMLDQLEKFDGLMKQLNGSVYVEEDQKPAIDLKLEDLYDREDVEVS